MVAIIKMSTIE
uniref:Uncharacterized protein n=1 Tax=Rhizophora mucronata TaxID=61149 RepID=A0A2P2NLX9_RHIMU